MIKRILFVLFFYVPETSVFSFTGCAFAGATLQRGYNAVRLQGKYLALMEKLPTATLQR